MSGRVVTLGTFDIPHTGHLQFLQRARAEANRYEATLVVGVNSDRFVEAYKGRRPVFTQGERCHAIAQLGFWPVEVNDGPGRDFIEAQMAKFDGTLRAIVISTDWLYPKDYLSQIGIDEDYLYEHNINLVFVPHTPGISTSDIIERVKARD